RRKVVARLALFEREAVDELTGAELLREDRVEDALLQGERGHLELDTSDGFRAAGDADEGKDADSGGDGFLGHVGSHGVTGAGLERKQARAFVIIRSSFEKYSLSCDMRTTMRSS